MTDCMCHICDVAALEQSADISRWTRQACQSDTTISMWKIDIEIQVYMHACMCVHVQGRQ